jgi:hypothetical protein
MSEQALVPPVRSDANVRGPMGVRRKAYKPKRVKDPNEEPVFQRIADRVSYGMGTPLNIAIWIVLVLGWTLLFALSSSKSIQGGTFLPAWFTSTGYNFPLNLVTTVAELYIGTQPGGHSCPDRDAGEEARHPDSGEHGLDQQREDRHCSAARPSCSYRSSDEGSRSRY